MLTTGGGTTKSVGEITKFWVPFMGGITKFWVPFMGGDHKIKFKDGIKIGIRSSIYQNFRGYAAFLLIFT